MISTDGASHISEARYALPTLEEEEEIRVLLGEGGEEFERGRVVVFREGFVGLVEERIGFLGLGLGGVGGASGKLGQGGNRQEKEGGKY